MACGSRRTARGHTLGHGSCTSDVADAMRRRRWLARREVACAGDDGWRRCGWDCEADGYDDDSNPLPQYKARYDAVMAALREGRTLPYSGKVKGQAARRG